MADFSIGKVGKFLGEIQRAYTWSFTFTPPSSVIKEMDFNNGDNEFYDDISIRCRSTIIPGRTFDVVTSKYAGVEQFFPTNIHYTNPFNVTFEEFQDKKIGTMLTAWQTLVGNAIRDGKNKSEFAVNCYLQLLNIDFDNTKNKPIVLINAWPENVAEVPLSYSENNAVQYSLSLRYDRWETM